VRLTADEWLFRLLESEPMHHPEVALRERLEELLFDHALRLLSLGVDVVLDFGVWRRSEREDFRARAASVGARSELHFLDVTLDELLKRLDERNQHLPAGTYIIKPEQIREWWTLFEPPHPDELAPWEPS
jgi:predicted kinase